MGSATQVCAPSESRRLASDHSEKMLKNLLTPSDQTYSLQLNHDRHNFRGIFARRDPQFRLRVGKGGLQFSFPNCRVISFPRRGLEQHLIQALVTTHTGLLMFWETGSRSSSPASRWRTASSCGRGRATSLRTRRATQRPRGVHHGPRPKVLQQGIHHHCLLRVVRARCLPMYCKTYTGSASENALLKETV